MKNKQLSAFCGVLVLCFFLFCACVKENTDTIVLPTPLERIPVCVIPQNLQDSLMHHGMHINEGGNPPRVEGHYLISPMSLQYASDYYSNLFHNLHVWFLRQNERGLISYAETQQSMVLSKPVYGGVIGHDSCFTVYSYTTLTSDSSGVTLWKCKIANVVSGVKTPQGIRDCQYSFIMLEQNAMDAYHSFLLAPVGTYRIFQDGDTMAEVQE